MRVRYSFSSRHTGKIENIAKQRKKYPDIVFEIIKISDIILEVLDARFINETRNLEIEEEIGRLNKKIIYVLNKCDLVNLNEKKIDMKKFGLYPYVFVSCTKRIGARELRTKIKISAKKIVLPKDGMERVQVGIIGYPNTGKSSLINFLSGKSAARVGAEAGFTKGIQKIKLSEGIIIIDTPGVIPKSEYSGNEPKAIISHARVNARDYSKVKNPEQAVSSILHEHKEAIESYYGIDSEGNSEILIAKIGREKNFLRKGGLIDEDRTARLILRDWQEGKIKF